MVWVKWWRWSRLTRIGKEKFRVNWSYIFKASCDFLPRGTRQTIKGRLPSRPSTLGSPPSCNNMSKRSYRNSQSLTCLEENYCILNDKKLNLGFVMLFSIRNNRYTIQQYYLKWKSKFCWYYWPDHVQGLVCQLISQVLSYNIHFHLQFIFTWFGTISMNFHPNNIRFVKKKYMQI